MTLFTIMNPFFDAADAGGTGGGQGDGQSATTGTQGTSGTQATQTDASKTGGTQSTQQTSSQAPGQTGSQTAFTYKEDRSDWIPRHRLNEVSSQNQTYKTQIDDLNRRLTIALGGEPTDPNTQKAQAIVEAFFKLPGMERLRRFVDMPDDRLESLLQVPDQISSSRDSEARQWERHGDQIVDTISGRVAEAIGAESLNDDQKADLRDTFKSWLQKRATAELQQAADRYGAEAVQRDQRRFSPTIAAYEKGDAKLLDEFVTRYSKNWVEPARRSATARTSTRTRPTPDGSGRTQVTQVTRPASFKSLDDRIDFALQVAKERGVQFDR